MSSGECVKQLKRTIMCSNASCTVKYRICVCLFVYPLLCGKRSSFGYILDLVSLWAPVRAVFFCQQVIESWCLVYIGETNHTTHSTPPNTPLAAHFPHILHEKHKGGSPPALPLVGRPFCCCRVRPRGRLPGRSLRTVGVSTR